jgi:hypothetical protein
MDTTEHKNLTLAQQGGTALAAAATLAMAAIKIYNLVKKPSEAPTES